MVEERLQVCKGRYKVSVMGEERLQREKDFLGYKRERIQFLP